jgi:hypothetical protein
MGNGMQTTERNSLVTKYAVFTNSSRSTPLLCPESAKASYRTASAAKAFALENTQMGGLPQYPYPCEACPFFHLTTNVTLRRTREHVKARRDLGQAVRRARAVAYTRSASRALMNEVIDEVTSADRHVRSYSDVEDDVDSIRAGIRCAMLTSRSVDKGFAQAIVDEMEPMALNSDSWTLVAIARDGLLDAASLAAGEGLTDPLVPALDRYMMVLTEHIALHDLNASKVFAAEFVMLSDGTSEWVEHSIYDTAVDKIVDVLFRVESAALTLAGD